MFLYAEVNELAVNGPLLGPFRERAEAIICERHYTRSVPSGKSRYYCLDGSIVAYSIPANCNIGKFLVGRQCEMWELTRLWAPDGHERNLLTRAISASVDWFRKDEPEVEALVSYADPNANHEGGVYRAASWIYTGQSEESRYYVGPDGEVAARRKFHSGSRGMTKAEIEAQGYRQESRPGKHRYARGLTRRARRDLQARWGMTKTEIATADAPESQPTLTAQAPEESARTDDTLESIAEEINAAHGMVGSLALSSLDHARQAGLLLIAARKKIDHGGWLPWLEANTSVPERTAQRYMRIAKNWDKISTKSAIMADLGVVEAVRLIGQPNDGPQAEPDGTKPATDYLDRLINDWKRAGADQRTAFLEWLKQQSSE